LWGRFSPLKTQQTRAICVGMREVFCFPQLDEIENPDSMFQHDGAQPRFAKIVRDSLNDKFSEKWVGRGGSILWPPRNSDLTPLRFCGAMLRILCVLRKLGT
jgi:hypothetical protein